jgi:hypothetical protein
VHYVSERNAILGLSFMDWEEEVSVDNDEKCELSSITAKVLITSLNSHFPTSGLSTKCGDYSEVAKVWIKVCNIQSPCKKVEPLLTLP